MTYDTDITIRTDSAVKHETQEIFDALGIDACTAVNMFLRQVIIHHGLPFRVALEPDIDMALEGTEFHGPFDSVEELMTDLND
ncbi:MAG: type II toxin-antitoxin system RelB/DinJ family antitoxin [Synergistaceae bacterium]|nr:type II toxin-antitoxin system RelB/DinJ family antitoxin [Synergistaceae bacterium]MBQ3346414.1 type II toxin-antitoxin system RelB/DinJ family antitoxin [Synergistaceae bacterium]MBQ3398007.1 type II toxin-antitoxin system RelB/DinJ family antitoxin [Synergistaceae bacterium]MBQ3759609.1 type II toxin-antitoxin system RelB/DinJ family antitoxin [Synergistaceae bacterium]MBQ6417213.1 type II toxin-antitoxin system RelB/DinJ family antitoxin [Synergistaceae bacterium]